jgi:hypothetical protein
LLTTCGAGLLPVYPVTLLRQIVVQRSVDNAIAPGADDAYVNETEGLDIFRNHTVWNHPSPGAHLNFSPISFILTQSE